MTSHIVSHARVRHLAGESHNKKPRRWSLKRLTAFLVAPAMLVTSMTLLSSPQSAEATTFTPTVSFGVTNAKDRVLAGEDASFAIGISHEQAGEPDQYNVSVRLLVPNGIEYLTSPDLGIPKIYEEGSELPNATITDPTPLNTVPTGFQVWVFENIHDLPQGGALSGVINVRPDATIFPVGSDIDIDVDVYTSSVETLLPSFDGSTGVATNNAHTSQPGGSLESTPVLPLRVFKSEPSPEQELLRGVHNNVTTYTIEVEYSGEADTSGAQVVDYIPAGLEYLGDGSIDNTQASTDLYGGDLDREYPGAGELNGAAPANYFPPTTVETIEFTDAEAATLGLGASAGGVYTVVTWDLPPLSGGTAQPSGPDGPTGPGATGTYVIEYLAAVPLFENTVDWEIDGVAVAAPDTDGDQAANLNNNNGPSTRHGVELPGHEDAKAYTNTVIGKGTYGGNEYTDDDEVTISAVDVRLLKSSDTSIFHTTGLALFTLTLETSEYTSADEIIIRDTMENGLFPALPANPVGSDSVVFSLIRTDNSEDIVSESVWNGHHPSVGEYPFSGAAQLTGGAVVTKLTHNERDGSFTVEMKLDGVTIDADKKHNPGNAHVVTYTALQRASYADTIDGRFGPTSSGDSVANHASLQGESHLIDGLVLDPTAGTTVTGEDVTWGLSETSDASIDSDFSALSKLVLERDAGYDPSTDTLDDLANLFVTDGVKNADEKFVIGDQVHYQIKIDFANFIDVRGPKITDFLPSGIVLDTANIGYRWQFGAGNADEGLDATYLPAPSFLYATPGDTTTPVRAIQWLPGEVIPVTGGGSERIVPRDSWLEIYLHGTVVGMSESSAVVDKPQNLAKYQQHNSEGVVYFERDEASIELDYGVTLLKGIESVTTRADDPDNSVGGTPERDYKRQADSDPHSAEFNPTWAGPPAHEPEYFGENKALNTNRDGIRTVQGEKVTFGIDLVAPQFDTENIVVWDYLPEGIAAADVITAPDPQQPQLFEKAAGDRPWDLNPVASSAFTFVVLDPSDPAYTTYLDPFGGVSVIPTEMASRSLGVWTITETLPGSDAINPADPPLVGLEAGAPSSAWRLNYTVEVPEDGTGSAPAELTQEYENTAGIFSYQPVLNHGGTVPTLFPTNDISEYTPTGADQFPASGTNTVDTSGFYLGDAEIEKELIWTEIGKSTEDPNAIPGYIPANTDPNNGAAQVVQGELATFEYRVTIPRNTTVQNAVLRDSVLPTNFVQYGDISVVFPDLATGEPDPLSIQSHGAEDGPATNGIETYTFDTRDFVLAWTNGVLTFPATYTNATQFDQVFSVQITGYINADLGHPTTRTNTAAFSFTDPNAETPTTITITDNATVQYIEPNVSITKAATGAEDSLGNPVPLDQIDADSVITYELVVSNANSRPILYDGVLIDTLPLGLNVDDATISSGGTYTAPVLGDTHGGTITWNLADLGAGDANQQTFTYEASIDPAIAGSAIYLNQAEVTGKTVPSTFLDPLNPADTPRPGTRGADDTESITSAGAEVTKSVKLDHEADTEFATSTSAPIGETVEYRVWVDLNKQINYYDVKIVDALPEGVSLVTPAPTVTEVANADGDPSTGTIGAWTLATTGTPATGETLTWTYNDWDIALHAQDRRIELRYFVQITDAVGSDLVLDNTATLYWNTTDDDDTTEKSEDDTATVNVLHPVLDIVKKVEGVDQYRAELDETFTYTVDVANTGNTPAYFIEMSDDIPAGVIVDASTIEVLVDDVFIGFFPTALVTPSTATDDGRIELSSTLVAALEGPLYQQGHATGTPKKITLRYDADLVEAEHYTGAEDWRTNTASVDEFQSFDTDGTGRTYTPTETDTAQVAPRFPSLTVTKNILDGPVVRHGDNVRWSLEIRNATGAAIGTAYDVQLHDVLPPNWVYDSTSAIMHQPASGSPVDLTPFDPTGAGTSASPYVWADDWELAPGESIIVVVHTIPTTSAVVGSANLHTNTLSGTAEDVNGDDGYDNPKKPYVGPEDDDSARILSADIQIEKTAIGDWTPGKTFLVTDPDYNNRPRWQITVSNPALPDGGPDSAFGAFTITDVPVYPTGVTQGTLVPATGSPAVGTSSGTGTVADPYVYVIGDATTELAVGSSFVYYIDVVIDTDVDTTDNAKNTVTVDTPTYDPDPDNNEDEGNKPFTPSADLGLVKTISNPPAPALPDAGGTIEWTIEIENHGPSTSRATTTDPITVVDTLPTAGLTGVTAVWGTGYAGDPDDIVVDFAGGTVTASIVDDMAVGDTITIVLTGTIAASFIGTAPDFDDAELENSAKVTPGLTPEIPGGTPGVEEGTEPNEDDVTTNIDGTTSLKIEKTMVSTDLVPGDPVVYDLTVWNIGTANAIGVVLTDSYDATQLDYVSFASQSGSWTSSNNPGDADPEFALTGALPPATDATDPAQGRTVRVTFNVDNSVDHDDTVTNWVGVTGTNVPSPPPDYPNTYGAKAEADLTINKVVKSQTPNIAGNAVAGGRVVYTVTVTNNGPSHLPAEDAVAGIGPITVVDTLDADLTYIGFTPVSAGWVEVSEVGQVITYEYPNGLLNGASISFDVEVEIADDVVPASGSTTRDNDVVVTGPNDPTTTPTTPFDTDPNNNDSKATITIVDQTIVTITKTATTFAPDNGGHPVAGGEVTYTLQVENLGLSEARNVVVTDQIPAGFTITSMSGTNWIQTAANVLSYDGPLAVGLAEPITVVGTISADYAVGVTAGNWRDLTNTAVVEWVDGDGPKSDDDDETVEVTPLADLVLVKTAQSPEAIAGDEITYTIEVSNAGISTADGPLTVTDQIPVGTSFVRYVSPGGDWAGGVTADPTELEFTRTLSLAPGATAGVIEVVLLVDSDAFVNGITDLTNIATVESPTEDPTPPNNTDTEIVPLTEAADLVIVKSHVGVGTIGEELSFSLVVTNYGASDARDVVVVDTLPVGLEYVDIDGSDPAWTATAVVNPDGTTTVTAELTGELARNQVAPVLTITTLVQVEAYPSVDNVADVSSTTPDPDPDNNRSTDPVPVLPFAHLEIEKEGVGTFQVGSLATYVITVSNIGLTEDPGPIVVTDVLPTGLEFRSSDSPDLVASGNTLTYTHPTALAVGASFEVEFEVMVLEAALPEIINEATVDTPTDLDSGSIRGTSTSNPVLPAPELADTAQQLPNLFLLAGILFMAGLSFVFAGQLVRVRRRAD